MEEPFSLRSTRNHSRQAFRAYPEWRRGIPRVEAGIAQTRMARGRRGIPRVEAPVPIRSICIGKPQAIGFALLDKISTGRLHPLHRRLHRRSTSAGGGGRVARSWWRELLPPSPGDHFAPLQAATPEPLDRPKAEDLLLQQRGSLGASSQVGLGGLHTLLAYLALPPAKVCKALGRL